MSQWKKIASFAALFASMALTTTGCVATDADGQMDDADVASVATSGDEADEKVGTADQSCCDADEDFAIRLFIHPFFTCFGGISPCGCGPFSNFGGCGCGCF